MLYKSFQKNNIHIILIKARIMSRNEPSKNKLTNLKLLYFANGGDCPPMTGILNYPFQKLKHNKISDTTI